MDITNLHEYEIRGDPPNIKGIVVDSDGFSHEHDLNPVTFFVKLSDSGFDDAIVEMYLSIYSPGDFVAKGVLYLEGGVKFEYDDYRYLPYSTNIGDNCYEIVPIVFFKRNFQPSIIGREERFNQKRLRDYFITAI